jgi:hypothetical protein
MKAIETYQRIHCVEDRRLSGQASGEANVLMTNDAMGTRAAAKEVILLKAVRAHVCLCWQRE